MYEVDQSKVAVLNEGYVKLVEFYGSDKAIVEAARMSTAKGFIGWGTPDEKGDEKLLQYLYDNKHATPFEMAGAVFEVQAPIMVFREWHRHRTQGFNEMSARYVQMPDLHYLPPRERLVAQSKTNKQGSDESIPLPDNVIDWFLDTFEKDQKLLYQHYEEALARGVPRELARINTPVSRYSRMRCVANLRNWMGFLHLRTAPNAQQEIRVYAKVIEQLLSDVFPRSMLLFKGMPPYVEPTA